MTVTRITFLFGLFSFAACAAQVPGQAPAPDSPAPPAAIALTLQQAEQLALQHNPQIAAARFQARAYEEISREFRAAYYPTLSANVTAVGADSGTRLAAGALNNPIVFNRVGSGVILSQLITDFGRTNCLVRSAALSAEAQQQAASFTRADLLLRTDGAYLAVLRTRALRDVARETVRARQDVVDQVNALFNSKLKSALDLSFSNVNLADAKLLLSDADDDLRSAEAQLARLLVLPIVTRFTLALPPAATAPLPDPDALMRQALRNRPDLLQRRLDLASAQQFARAEQLLVLPTIGVEGTAGYVPAADPQVPSRYGAIGLNIRIPVFTGGLFRARRLEAEARAAAAQKHVQDVELQIARDVRVAWLDAKKAFDRLALTRQLVEQGRLALDLAQSRYQLGLSAIVELSQAQLQYTSAELAQARAEYDYAAQLSILYFQAGQLP